MFRVSFKVSLFELVLEVVIIVQHNKPSVLVQRAFGSSNSAVRSHDQVTTYNNPRDSDPYYVLYGPGLNIDNSDTVETFSGHSDREQYCWQVQASDIAGSGPWSGVSAFTFATTDVKGEAGTPTRFSISQNYPNPFNPTTIITFALPTTARTTITLYDLLGRTVRTLINRELVAGYHEIHLDASSLSSAVYFYTIQAGGFVQTKKVVVTK